MQVTFTVSMVPTFTGVPLPLPTTILSDKGTDVDHELVVDLPNVLKGREGDGDLSSGLEGREEEEHVRT